MCLFFIYASLIGDPSLVPSTRKPLCYTMSRDLCQPVIYEELIQLLYTSIRLPDKMTTGLKILSINCWGMNSLIKGKNESHPLWWSKNLTFYVYRKPTILPRMTCYSKLIGSPSIYCTGNIQILRSGSAMIKMTLFSIRSIQKRH